MKDIYLFIIVFSMYKSCAWKKKFQDMVVEKVFNNENQIMFFKSIYILKRKIYSCVYY